MQVIEQRVKPLIMTNYVIGKMKTINIAASLTTKKIKGAVCHLKLLKAELNLSMW